MNQNPRSSFLCLILLSALLASGAHALEVELTQIMFAHVNVWDGTSESLDMNTNVLVEGNLIKAVGSSISQPEGTTVIDGGGRTLMPGLIESHVHLNYQHMIGGCDTIELAS